MLKSRVVWATMAAALAFPAAARADTYVVQLKDAPLATYAGGRAGIPATTPRVTGRKLKVDSAPGLDYRAYLARRQKAVLGRLAHAPKVVYAYRYALSGFAADLTRAQADQLASAPGVKSVEPTELERVDVDDPDVRLGGAFGDSPAYLRLTAPDVGLWNQLGGPLAADGAGAGVIVGDIDTGIQPGHPSFSNPPPLEGAPYSPPAVWDGACEAGDGFDATECNDKLIGARYFVDGFGSTNVAPDSFLSPRDDDGHGTDTASIAAGNYGVDPSIDGNTLGVDLISGVAPRAYVAAYKACWNGVTAAQTGCNSADVVAAIDRAVADGVDVINLSLSGNGSTIFGPQQAALLNAAAAGVFVADSAGNGGPGSGTVAQPSDVPWTTAVAASTLHRSFVSSVAVAQAGVADFTVQGASVTGGLPSTPLVDAAAVPGTGVTPAVSALCEPDSLDPAAVAGKVVLCLRGGNDRIDKSKVVAAAGGVGMILYNATAAQELDTDTHWVPTAHVTFADGQRIKAAIGPATTVSLTAGSVDTSQAPRVLAAFSARGPQAAVPDILKPDLSAPGVQILAGMADRPSAVTGNRPGQLFATMQGTSQAAPQVAGAGALLTQVMPTLSPAEIKSELMMTANPAVTKEDGATPATPFDAGAGEIDPNKAAHAGLVLDATLDDYIHYLEFLDPTIVNGDQPKLRPSDLNLPSIAFSRLAGKDSMTRTFRSIDPTATRWAVSVVAPPGFTATADTDGFRISPGQTQSVTVTVTRGDAPLNQWAFGALVLTSGERTLRLPIAVRPIFGTVTSPIVINTADASGSVPETMRPGWSGPLSELGFGPAPAVVQAAGRRIPAGSGRPDPTGADPGTQLYSLDVPAGTELMSARLANVDGGAAGPNLDLYLYRDPNGDGDLSDAVRVTSSTRGDSAEQLNVVFPAAGRYVIAVVGVVTQSNGGSSYDLSSWVVADGQPDDGGLAVTGEPAAVTPGDPVTLPLRWAGLGAKGLYLGLVTYHASTAPAPANVGAVSVVELTKTVDTPTPTPAPTATPTPETPPAPSVTPGPPRVPERAGPHARPEPRLGVRAVRLSGRTLRLWLRNAAGSRVHAAVKHGKRFVATSRAHRAPAHGPLKLHLTHRLRSGHYTLKVMADRDGRRTVVRVALRRR